MISVADCEGDIYDVFLEAERRGAPAALVIRAKGRPQPCRSGDPEAGSHAYRKAWDAVAASEVIATRELSLRRTPKRAAREATLEVRARRLTIKPPHTRARDPQVTLGMVLVEEVDAPEDGTAVRWKLLTSLPVESGEEALRVWSTTTRPAGGSRSSSGCSRPAAGWRRSSSRPPLGCGIA